MSATVLDAPCLGVETLCAQSHSDSCQLQVLAKEGWEGALERSMLGFLPKVTQHTPPEALPLACVPLGYCATTL